MLFQSSFGFLRVLLFWQSLIWSLALEMHYWFVPRGEPCAFVVLKPSIFWTDAKKGGGTAMFVDGGAIACCICCISGSLGGGGG